VSRGASWASGVARLLRTDSSGWWLIQRVTLGVVVLAHGMQKAFGVFGGFGFDGTVGWFQQALNMPAAVAVLVIASDLLGALALVVGALSRVTAAAIAATMLGAIALVHAPNGFFMNWAGTQAGEGYEFHLLALALAVPLIARGGGAWSVDGWLWRHLGKSASSR
jgi:putative oxidoreductase